METQHGDQTGVQATFSKLSTVVGYFVSKVKHLNIKTHYPVTPWYTETLSKGFMVK